MDASALVVLRCCGSDVAAFAAALAAAMRAARPDRQVIVEASAGDVTWRPPAHAPASAVRLVLVCGVVLEAERLRLPETTRPVHLTALVVAPDGRDPAQPVQAVALPRVFADVLGVAGAATMLHGLLDGDEREEDLDTDEWLTPDAGDVGIADFADDGTVPPWPSSPEGASGLEEFRGSVPAPAASEPPPSPNPVAPPARGGHAPRASAADAPKGVTPRAPAAPDEGEDTAVRPTPRAEPGPPIAAAPAPTVVLTAPPPVPRSAAPPPSPLGSGPPRPTETAPAAAPPVPGPNAPSPQGTAAKAAAPTAAAPASPAGKVAQGLKRIAGAVEQLAASVVNDWILRAPPEVEDGAAGGPAPPAAPRPAPETPGTERVAVALGASAPRTAAPGGEFTARFIAHVPGRERAVAVRLADLSPEARTHLNVKQCQWAPGTPVTVTLRARGLQVEPPSRTFTWHDDEHVEEFDVTVPADTPLGPLVLKFDAAIEGVVVATLRVDLVVTTEAGARRARTSATTTAARTAFASYASADRARVLDRVAAVRISAGLDVFVDCLSLHPGEAWRTRLASEIRDRDVFLLFWSASASASTDVAWECRTAIEARGVDAVQLHPLEPDVLPPAALADRHAGDPLMWARRATAPRTGA